VLMLIARPPGLASRRRVTVQVDAGYRWVNIALTSAEVRVVTCEDTVFTRSATLTAQTSRA